MGATNRRRTIAQEIDKRKKKFAATALHLTLPLGTLCLFPHRTALQSRMLSI